MNTQPDTNQLNTHIIQIYESLIQGHYPEDILNNIYQNFQTLLPYDRLGCATYNPTNNTLTSIWNKTNQPQTHLKKHYTANITNSTLNHVIHNQTPRIINNLQTHHQQNPHSQSTRLLLKENIQSSLTCPLIINNRTIGALFFSSTKPNTYTHQHQQNYLKIAGAIATLIDKSQTYQHLTQTNLQLHHLATHDHLTGLQNRSSILQNLQTKIQQNTRQHKPITIGIIDIDNFKTINDTWGHQIGDQALHNTAQTLKNNLRAGDQIGRYGGEEFIYYAECKNPQEATTIAERLRQATQQNNTLNPPTPRTNSIGITTTQPNKHTNIDQLIQQADQALYQAKKQGKNQTIHHT